MVFKMGELFCGPGGLALGAERAYAEGPNGEFKIKPLWANDIDQSTCETYRNNIIKKNGGTIIESDVRELDIAGLAECDGLAFGFPCNDFSVVGEKRGIHGTYGNLYQFGVKVLNIHEPQWFIAENVTGLLSANAGSTFITILEALKTAGPGYETTTHLYKFEEYGVPQSRHRIIIVGIRRDLGLQFKVPAPTTPNRPRTARDALENPPIPDDAPNNERTRHTQKVVKMLEYIPPGGNAWCENIPKELRLNVKGARMSQIYRRLDPNQPAYTVTGSGGGGTHMYHWDEPRALTNRERARLQTFPDDFVFIGPKENVRRQIGMAVPPDGAAVIFQALMNTFAGIEYNWVESSWSQAEENVLELA